MYGLYIDRLGNIMALSWMGGTFVPSSKARYDPFGTFTTAPTASNPAISNHGFTGHRHNNTGANDLGLIYMNARYYLPEVGRFISADTIVPEPGEPQSYNRYAYSINNPIKYNDQSGHWFESALDLAFLAYDIYDIQQNGLTWTSGLSLAADVAGLALPVVTGGGLAIRALAHGGDVAKIASHADEAVKAVSRVEDVRQARRSGEITQSVLNKIDPSRFDETGRFGAAFYVAQEGATAVKEVAAHGGQASHVIRYQADLSKAKILDLTDPGVAKAWGYTPDASAVGAHQQLSAKAMEQGYNAIRFTSYRGSGYNYAFLDNPLNPFNFDEWLVPQMVSPVPNIP